MNSFRNDSNLLEEMDLLKCLEDENIDQNLFDDITPNDGSLNLQPDLCSIDDLDSSMQFVFPYGNNFESDSPDSGNYSPNSSASEQQQQFPWSNTERKNCSFSHPSQSSTSVPEWTPPSQANYFENNNFDELKPTFLHESISNSGVYGYTVNECESIDTLTPLICSDVNFSQPPLSHQPQHQTQHQQQQQQQPQKIFYVIHQDASSSQSLTISNATNSGPLYSQSFALPLSAAQLPPESAHYRLSSGRTFPKRFGNVRMLPPKPEVTYIQQCNSPNISFVEDEEFLRRKENRKLKNRAAAQLSRIRKRNEMDQIKQKLSEKEKECNALRTELNELRNIVGRLQNENKGLLEKNNSFGSVPTNGGVHASPAMRQQPRGRVGAVKKAGGFLALALCAFIAFPGANYNSSDMMSIDPISNKSPMLNPNDKLPKLSHLGHALLTSNGGFSNTTNRNKFEVLQNVSSYISCPDGSLYNSSQNLRLNKELLNWIERHDQMNFVQLRRGNFPSVIFNHRLTTNSGFKSQKNFLKYLPSIELAEKWADEKSNKSESKSVYDKKHSLIKRTDRKRDEQIQQKLKREMTYRHLNMITRAPTNEVQHGHFSNFSNSTDSTDVNIVDRQKMIDFTSKIQQNEDTLYVVALKDYFLLPALDKSKAAPKISLILPALASNGSAPSQLTMMRIECNVVATSVFYLPDSVISLFNKSILSN